MCVSYWYRHVNWASMLARRSNQSGWRTDTGYQLVSSHMSASAVPVRSSLSHCMATDRCGTSFPASYMASVERLNPRSAASLVWVIPNAVRARFSWRPQSAPGVSASPVAPFR